MANRISGRPWTLDTATPGVPVLNSWIKIVNIVWSGYGASVQSVSLTDVNGANVFSATNRSDQSDVVSLKIGWVHGLIPAVISSGLVTVYIE